ncbi:MAG: PspC domain-containing protein [Ignavibacteria bacterium]|nr:PspC domain-containing protein [Ignavibacteria bacterium]
MTKRLYRSRKEKMIAGVAGGIAQYLEIDPVFVRIAFVCLIFFHGAGIIIYFVSALIIPKEELFAAEQTVEEKQINEQERAAVKANRKASRDKYIGVILIILGAIFLADNLFIDINFENVFPLGLIGLGSWMVYNTFKKEKENELKNKNENENAEEVQ